MIQSMFTINKYTDSVEFKLLHIGEILICTVCIYYIVRYVYIIWYILYCTVCIYYIAQYV